MNKKILVLCVAMVASFASNVFAFEVNQLTSATEIQDQINSSTEELAARGFECFAHSDRGFRFRGFDRFPETAQRIAMGECYRHSRFCYADGCHPF